jgi:hypothetical protein
VILTRDLVTGDITLQFTSDEREVVDWIYSTGATKFKMYIDDFIKQRTVNKKAFDDRDFMAGFQSMSETEKIRVEAIVRDCRTR